jgi:hypothetical protein
VPNTRGLLREEGPLSVGLERWLEPCLQCARKVVSPRPSEARARTGGDPCPVVLALARVQHWAPVRLRRTVHWTTTSCNRGRRRYETDCTHPTPIAYTLHQKADVWFVHSLEDVFECSAMTDLARDIRWTSSGPSAKRNVRKPALPRCISRARAGAQHTVHNAKQYTNRHHHHNNNKTKKKKKQQQQQQYNHTTKR